MAKSHNLAKVQHTNLHRTQITNTSEYIMAKLQLAKLKGNLTDGIPNREFSKNKYDNTAAAATFILTSSKNTWKLGAQHNFRRKTCFYPAVIYLGLLH